LYDKDFDNIEKGKCCYAIDYMEFPEAKLKCIPGEDANCQKESEMEKYNRLSRYCIQFSSFNEYNFRICSPDKTLTNSLQLKLVENVIKSRKPLVGPDELSK